MNIEIEEGIMDSYRISLQITDAQSRLSAAQSQLRSLRKDTSDLEGLSRQHASMQSAVTSDMEARMRRLEGCTLDPLKVRSFASYKAAMQEKLSGGQRITSSLDDTSTRITRAKDDVDSQIASASRSCDSIESEISTLQVRLLNAKALEASL
jgi:chromosome segregation ATPase